LNSYGCPACTREEVRAPSPNVAAEFFRGAPPKYQLCGMAKSLPLYEEAWATSAPAWPSDANVTALQQRIRDLQEQIEVLVAIVDDARAREQHYLAKLTEAAILSLPSPVVVSKAAIMRWVPLSSGWHHWPCVTAGVKAPEREPHPLHRAIAVRKEGFPRG